MFRKLLAAVGTALACASCLAVTAGVARASGTAPATTTTLVASITATTASIEGTITPDGAPVTAASFCYGTSATLASCTTVSLSSSAYTSLSSSSTNDPVYASVSGLAPNTTYYYSLSATNADGTGSSATPYGAFTTRAVGAFTCTPSFYQVSSTGSGALYSYSIAGNAFTRIGSGAVSSINGLGYDTADNYLYGVSGSTLYQINNDGQFTSLGTVSGLTQSTGADFYNGQLLETASSGLSFESVNVSTKTESPFTLTDHAIGGLAGAGSYTATDLTVQGNYGYGVTSTTTGSTLYVVDLANKYLASIPVTGLPNAPSGTYSYGAAYSDSDGDAYFYNNTTHIMYEISSSALQTARANGTDPTAIAIGSGASTPGLDSPNDGATCPNAASPYAPSVNPPSTGAVGTTTTTVNGVVSPDDATLSGLAFCYSTGSDVAAVGGALSDSPTCVSVDDSVYPYETWTGTNLYNTASTLTGLSGCTTYYYQSEATNSDGTAYSSVANFTTNGCQTVSFTSTAPTNATVGGTYTPTGTATSGLAPVVSVDSSSSGICSIASGVVSFAATGSCVLNLNQAGNSSYAAAPQVQQTLTVSRSSQTVSFTSTAPTNATVGGTYTPTGTATSGLAPVVSVDSSSSGICSIASGVVSFAATGSCVLNLNQAGNSSYAAAPQVQQTLTVSRSSQTVSFTSTAPTNATVGGTYTPTGTATSGLAPVVSVDSSSSGICSIASGVVSFAATGSCVLNLNQAGNSSYAAAPQVQQTLTVSRSSQTVSFTSTAPTNATVGGTYTPTGTATSGLAPVVSVDSSSSGICSIASGVVSFAATGSCVLNLNQAGNSSYAAAPQVQQTLTVSRSSQTVSFTSTAPTNATVGGTYTPTGTATSGLAPVVSVDSSSSGICSIASGVVSFAATGSCVLNLNQAGNSSYAAAPQVQQTLTVNGTTLPTATTTSTAVPPAVDTPINQVTPTISGTPALGQVVEASVGGWAGSGLTYRYQWLRDGVAIPGATSAAYLVTAADSGHSLSVQVIASDGTVDATAASQTVLALQVDIRGCTAPSGRLTARAIGTVRLGMTRAEARRLVASTQPLNSYTDNLCLAGGYGIRVGYGNATMLGHGELERSLSSRIVFATTANPYYALDGVRPGVTVASVARRLHLTRQIRIGPNVWYVIPGRRFNHVLKTRHGVVQEIGNLNRALTLTRGRQGRLLRLF